jgi:hypothetical protein
MRKEQINQNIPLSWNVRLIKKLWNVEKSESYPSGLEFSFQLLYKIGERWYQYARIDNQLHEGKPGTHIHIGKRVIWEELTYREARDKILLIAEKVIQNED